MSRAVPRVSVSGIQRWHSQQEIVLSVHPSCAIFLIGAVACIGELSLAAGSNEGDVATFGIRDPTTAGEDCMFSGCRTLLKDGHSDVRAPYTHLLLPCSSLKWCHFTGVFRCSWMHHVHLLGDILGEL